MRSALVAWRPRAPGLRPVRDEALHVTLAFLGERDAGDVEPAGAVLRACARPVRALSVGEAVWLPSARRPRVLAVGLRDGDGALGAVQAAVAGGLAGALGWEPEARRFLPHVTVARVRAGARTDPALAPLTVAGPFAAPALTLYRSLLGRGGARYEALERVAL